MGFGAVPQQAKTDGPAQAGFLRFEAFVRTKALLAKERDVFTVLNRSQQLFYAIAIFISKNMKKLNSKLY